MNDHDLHEIEDDEGKRTDCRGCGETHRFDPPCPAAQLGLGEVS